MKTIKHAHDIAPCDCPAQFTYYGVDCITAEVLYRKPGCKTRAVYRCRECKRVWGVKGRREIVNALSITKGEAIMEVTV